MRSDWRELALAAVVAAFATHLLTTPRVELANASPPTERSSASGPWCKRWTVEWKRRTQLKQDGAPFAEPLSATQTHIFWKTCTELLPTHGDVQARRKAESARRARQEKAQQERASRLKGVTQVRLGSALAVAKGTPALELWVTKKVRFHLKSGALVEGVLVELKATLAWLQVGTAREQVDLIAVTRGERLN